jgi:outer membrane protein assembly factor BamB
MKRLLLIFALHLGVQLFASDWPQFLGPTRDGVYPATDLAATWPTEGPPVRWQKKVGPGFSGPVVASGKLILFHRLEDKATVECLDSKTGKSLWSFDYPTSYKDDFGFDEGPRATPAIAQDRVYVYGAEGMLHALDFGTGKKLWSIDLTKNFGAPKGFFGIACSPLVERKAVLLTVGGRPDAGIIAFDGERGSVLWKSTTQDASYSSPVAATIHNRRYALFLTRAALVALAPENGKQLFEFPFSPAIRSSVTAATPLVIDDQIFISASYDAGAVMLKLNGTALEKLWANDDLSSHYATSVHYQGFLYGIHGRTDPSFEPATLRCLDAKTGQLRWEQKGFGAAIIIRAADQLLLLTERGELIRVVATPQGYKSNARAQILPSQTRAHPALADGLFYARSKDKLVCVDLTGGGTNTK